MEYLEESGTSIYFRDPNGARLELIADPLGEMYGTKVLRDADPGDEDG